MGVSAGARWGRRVAGAASGLRAIDGCCVCGHADLAALRSGDLLSTGSVDDCRGGHADVAALRSGDLLPTGSVRGLGRVVPAGDVRGLGRPRTRSNTERETRFELATFSLEG